MISLTTKVPHIPKCVPEDFSKMAPFTNFMVQNNKEWVSIEPNPIPIKKEEQETYDKWFKEF